MKLKTIRILLTFVLTNSAIAAFAQQMSDTAYIGMNLDAMAFFDNKEFTNGIKKGYTLPGFYIDPSLSYSVGNFDLRAGIHAAYFAGADSTYRLQPTLLISYSPVPILDMRLGSLPRGTRRMPEPLYKPERVFAERPPLGIEFALNHPCVAANLWLNWERYIERGSPFQEEFMVAFSGCYSLRGEAKEVMPSGLSASLYAVATHVGGQIDSSNLPVTSIANLGLNLAYGQPLGSGLVFGSKVSAYLSADISPNPHIDYKRGFAAQYTLWLRYKGLQAEAGFWRGDSFVTPRGEEIFGSISTRGSLNYNEQRRRLLTLQAAYVHSVLSGFDLRFSAGVYAASVGQIDYFYTLTMGFSGALFGRHLR